MKNTGAILLLFLLAVDCGKRLHFKIDGESIWWDFYSDGTCCAGMGEERAKGQWSTSGNRLKTWAPIYEGGPVDDDYLVFADLTARAGSEVIGMNSVDQAESEGVKGMIVRVEPIPPASDATDPTPPEDKGKSAKIQLQALGKALELYQIDMNSYPDPSQGLLALQQRPTEDTLGGISEWGGPYMKKAIPDDPWGQPYLYSLDFDDNEQQIYTICSAGPNMQNENGEGDDIAVHSNK
jgi:type II secretion system protein G